MVALPGPAGATSHVVGIGRSADPYEATLRAVSACATWPGQRIAGRTVVIKTNLVGGLSPQTGATTDAQVVRALVDLALQHSAARIVVAESGGTYKFGPSGYGFFHTYDGAGRVQLVDLAMWGSRLFRVAGGSAYGWIYLPEPLLDADVVFVSAAKLKCHAEAVATLSMKNLFGLPPAHAYRVPESDGIERFAMHDRGLHQTVVDLNLLRPVDFAVVDGVWGMQGYGPLRGTPVHAQVVAAGSNALAVDRVSLQAMGLAQEAVPHLNLAAAKGLGPADIDSIAVVGDSLPLLEFQQPLTPPGVYPPVCSPRTFSAQAGDQTTITYFTDRECRTRVDVVRTWDTGPWVQHVRQVADWEDHAPGVRTVSWDGRGDDGNWVAPGRYTVRVQGNAGQASRDAFATCSIRVA
jgi:uncharacterized protein (DUF362 family)